MLGGISLWLYHILHFFVADKVKHLHVLFALCGSSLDNCMLVSLAHLKFYDYFVFLLSFKISLQILNVDPLSNM